MAEKKTLAFVTHSLNSGGAERVIATLANTLVEKYRVLIITLVSGPSFYRLDTRVERYSCKETVAPSRNPLAAMLSNFGLLRRLASLLKGHRVDVCIGFLTTSNVLSVLASKWTGIPVIVSERNNPVFEDRLIPRFWKILRRAVYPKADFLVVQNEAIRAHYADQVQEYKIHIIGNPINPEFSPSDKPSRKPVILNVGRLSDQKRQEMLIRAFADMETGDWELHILGEGENRTSLEQLIAEKGLTEKVRLLGRTKDVQYHYDHASIFAFSSEFEGFPNALIEAMYFGLACVSTDCPTGPSELIEDGVSGFLIPVGDGQAMQDRLQWLLEHPDERLRMGERARTRTAHLTVEKIVADWETLIREAANR